MEDSLLDIQLLKIPRRDITNLIYYADMVAKILKDNGWPGKAKALEDRYMKIAKIIGLE